MLDFINKKNTSLSDNLKINISKENSEVENFQFIKIEYEVTSRK